MISCGSEPYAYGDDTDPPPAHRYAAALPPACPVWLRGLVSAAAWGPDADDRRFTDPAWTSAPCYRTALQAYLTWRRLLLSAARAPYLPVRRRQQAEFLAQVVADALAPTNFLPGNPAALRRAAATRGLSLVRGTGNFLDDLVRRRGRPAKMRPDAYRLGENLAATPGRVVHRNDVMEVLQYEPQTPQVYEVPLLLVPAWVNKYYIYDLAPGRSLAEWAVRQGFTVFTISMRDPEPRQAGLGLDEYFRQVPLTALDVVRDITHSPHAHLVGVCAGGMAAASAAAWLAARGEPGAASLTLLMSALDYAPPEGGEEPPDAEIGLLVRLLSNRSGLIDSTRISVLFDLLRARDTIWSPLVSGWLLGERPRPFDIWAWSEDGICVPPALFEQTMRIAAGNTLARGALRLNGRSIDLSAVSADAFVVSGARDHIVPWETAYRSARLLGGEVDFHLVPSGHVGSIVSPPRRAATYRTGGGGLPERPQDWSARSSPRQESWWAAWSRWLGARSGSRVPGRAAGSARYPAGAPAPGLYARSR